MPLASPSPACSCTRTTEGRAPSLGWGGGGKSPVSCQIQLDLGPLIACVLLGAWPCGARAPGQGQLPWRVVPAPGGLGSVLPRVGTGPAATSSHAARAAEAAAAAPQEPPWPLQGGSSGQRKPFYLSGLLLTSPRTRGAWQRRAGASPCCHRTLSGCLLARCSARIAKPMANPWTCPLCPRWPWPCAHAEGGCEAAAPPRCPGSTTRPCPGWGQGLIWGPGLAPILGHEDRHPGLQLSQPATTKGKGGRLLAAGAGSGEVSS